MDQAVFWLDVETTGLDAQRHELLEIAAVITDVEGNQLSPEYSSLIKPPQTLSELLDSASEESVAMHERSGLWSDLWDARNLATASSVEAELSQLIEASVGEAILIPAGTSVALDLSFVRISLPGVSSRLTHQLIDTTTLKAVVEHLYDTPPFMRRGLHRALPDTWDAIHEYRTYIDYLRSER